MRESKIETYLRVRIHRLGGECIKMGQDGWNDRLVILPRLVLPSALYFVELKATNGRVKPHQERRHETLRKHGLTVLVPKSKEDIDRMFPL